MTVIVRAAAPRLSGFWNSTSAKAVDELSVSVPVELKLAVLPQAIVAPAPPRLTFNGAVDAAKPPADEPVHWTWPAPVPIAAE